MQGPEFTINVNGEDLVYDSKLSYYPERRPSERWTAYNAHNRGVGSSIEDALASLVANIRMEHILNGEEVS